MDLNFTPEENAFRSEVKAFLDQKLPGDVKRKVLEHRRLNKDDILRWHKALFAKGWIAPHW
ncbi:MAG: pimeloyl-CoA dehydrogenase large subunit, partial [Burkholderiales bacterium]